METNTVIHTVEHIKENIETSIEILIHTEEDITKAKEKLPKKVSALVGATKLHVLQFEIDGKIKKKNLPTDPFFKAVQIKTPRAIIRRPRNKDAINEAFMDEAAEETADKTDEETSNQNENEEDIQVRRSDRQRRRQFHFEDKIEELNN